MNSFDDKLSEIVDYCAESYYPEHEYGDSHKEQNQEYLREAIEQIKQAIREDIEEAKKLLAYEDDTESYYYALETLSERMGL